MDLPGKITAQGRALAPIAVATRPKGAPLTVILLGKRMPGTEDGATAGLAGAVIGAAYGGYRLACGGGVADEAKPPRKPGRSVDITARIARRQVLSGLIGERRRAV
jgi:hypothetical protein